MGRLLNGHPDRFVRTYAGQSSQGVRRGAPFRRGLRAAAMALATGTAPTYRNWRTYSQMQKDAYFLLTPSR